MKISNAWTKTIEIPARQFSGKPVKYSISELSSTALKMTQKLFWLSHSRRKSRSDACSWYAHQGLKKGLTKQIYLEMWKMWILILPMISLSRMSSLNTITLKTEKYSNTSQRQPSTSRHSPMCKNWSFTWSQMSKYRSNMLVWTELGRNTKEELWSLITKLQDWLETTRRRMRCSISTSIGT